MVFQNLQKKLRSPEGLLYLALAVGIAMTVAQTFFSVDLYRDSANVYAFMARALAEGDFQDAVHPAIPSLNVLLSRPFTLLGLRPEQALGAVSGIFYLLSIVFLYHLLAEFLPGTPAGVGTLLYAFAPKVIRFSYSAIIDSGKLCFLIAALYFAYKLIRCQFRSYAHAFCLGAMLGGLALARSEGIGSAAVIAVCTMVYYAIEIRRRKKLPPVLPMLTAAAAFLVPVLSRMWLIQQHSGRFIFDSRIANGIARLAAKFTSSPVAAAAVAAAPKPLRTSWWHLINQNLRGEYELYLPFTIVGIILIILAAKWKDAAKLYPDKQLPPFVGWNSFYAVFIVIVLTNALTFKLADIAAYRYFLLNIPMLMVFTLIGLHWLWGWFAKYLPVKLLCVAAAAVFLFQIVNGTENFFKKAGRRQYETGLYIGRLLDAEHNTRRVWFRNACVEWYYSGMRRAFPIETPTPDAATFKGFDYVLWADDEDDLEVIAARKDLREIPLPEGCRVRLFQRIE